MAATAISGGVESPPMFCLQSTGGDDPRPWPFRSIIKARCLDNVHSAVRTILESAISEWLKSLPSQEIFVEWVKEGNADVRFGMGNGVTSCALGIDARSIPQEKPTAILGLNKWKIGETETVWTISELERLARHVWGHILGLPHAYDGAGGWKLGEVGAVCDAAGVPKSQVSSLTGNRQLNTTDSIMHFDRPAYLTSNSTHHPANAKIDTASVKLVTELYPRLPDVDCFAASVKDCSGFTKDNWTSQRVYSMIKSDVKTNGWQRVSALRMIDLGTNAKYQACAYTSPAGDGSKSLMVNIGAMDSNVHVHDIQAMFLSFDQSDTRIRTGFMETVTERGGDWNSAPRNEQRKKRFEFIPPFKDKPQVVAFIFRFSVDKGSWIRIAAHPKGIDKTGFTLHINTWDDTIAYDMSAYWIAHQKDDPTIRSGRFSSSDHIDPVNSVVQDSSVLKFSPPFSSKPRYMLYGFDIVNARNGINARLRCEEEGWDQNVVKLRLSTWVQESNYMSLGVSYIALL